MKLRCGRFHLRFERPLVMGIVNLTDDSFSGDGVGGDLGRALAAVRRQIDAGADLIDLGAESSRPGAIPISAEAELERLIPLLDALAGCPVPISVDTCKPNVMHRALEAGASMINDIEGFRAAGAVEAVAGADCGLCVMHMQGGPGSMQDAPAYGHVVSEVRGFLDRRVETLEAAGIARDRIAIDPGFGFGKTLAHNLELFRNLPQFAAGGLPVLVGVSRKSMLGAITGRPGAERLASSVSAALLAAQRGAAILRVHDVAATRDAIAVMQAIESN